MCDVMSALTVSMKNSNINDCCCLLCLFIKRTHEKQVRIRLDTSSVEEGVGMMGVVVLDGDV